MAVSDEADGVAVEVVSPLPRPRFGRLAWLACTSAAVALLAVWVLSRGDEHRVSLRPAVAAGEPTGPETSAARTSVAWTTTSSTSTTSVPSTTVATDAGGTGWGGVGLGPADNPKCNAVMESPLMPNLVGLTQNQAFAALDPFQLYSYCHSSGIFMFQFNIAGGQCNLGPAPGSVITSQGIPVGTLLDPSVIPPLDLTYDLPCSGTGGGVFPDPPPSDP